MSAEKKDWPRYYARTEARPPRATLLEALARFEAEGVDPSRCLAVDLGSGGGCDAAELLRRGWPVLAVDAEPSAGAALRARADLPAHYSLRVLVARFEDAAWPPATLVNSSFALPLVPPSKFPDLWAHIVESLVPGGRISTQLFGERDSWFGDPTITFFRRAELEPLLANLEVELLREEENDGTTPKGKRKHWHVYHLVARKPAPPPK